MLFKTLLFSICEFYPLVVLVVGDAHFWFIFVFCQGDGTSLRILQELVQEIGECLQEVQHMRICYQPAR